MNTRTLLHGEKDRITPIPEAGWMEELLASPAHIARRLEFMPPDHRRIRNLAVTRIAAGKGPVRVDWLVARLAMTPTEVEARLDELERGLFFVVRDSRGHVNWAFPFSAEETPHVVDLGRAESPPGLYLTLAQAVTMVRVAQAALFQIEDNVEILPERLP
jgi:hypothetical protein